MTITFRYCEGCAVEWPAAALVDGLCPACRPSPQPSPQGGEGVKPEPDAAGAGVHTRPEPSDEEYRPPNRHLRQLEEQAARERLAGFRGVAVEDARDSRRRGYLIDAQRRHRSKKRRSCE